MMPSKFQIKVYEMTKKIPKGKVTTYKEIAKMIGKPKAARGVGRALNKNKNKNIPCHRVVKSNGEVGGFNQGKEKKIKKLKKEGIEIIEGKIDLKKYLFKF